MMQGEAVYSSWEALSTLRAELPTALPIQQAAFNAYWVHLQHANATTASTFLRDALQFRHVATEPGVAHEQALVLTPEITLYGYHFAPAPHSPLADYRWKIREMEDGIELFLLWQVQDGAWPPALSISVRLTQDGEMLEGAQIDRTQPAAGLTDLPLDFLPDPYHFTLRHDLATAVDGATIILYRQAADGFENVGIASLTWHQ
ncbi:MAG: hypothetical protein R2932_12205 [Caldilineaceae bacterium]